MRSDLGQQTGGRKPPVQSSFHLLNPGGSKVCFPATHPPVCGMWVQQPTLAEAERVCLWGSHETPSEDMGKARPRAPFQDSRAPKNSMLARLAGVSLDPINLVETIGLQPLLAPSLSALCPCGTRFLRHPSLLSAAETLPRAEQATVGSTGDEL